jgi:hypothetical protein
MDEDDLLGLLEKWRELVEKETYTALPAIIESFDSETNTATILPGLKTKYDGETNAEEMPRVQDVPVVIARTGLGMALMPIQEGDIGLAVFSSRSISEFIAGAGNPVYPEDSRQFDLSDAYFIPGGYPTGKKWPLAIPSDAIGQSLANGAKLWFGGDVNETLTLNLVKNDIINILHTLISIVITIDATPDPSGANAAKLGELLAAVAKRQVT